LSVGKQDRRPQWPPTKEDLERLYLLQRLSAAKIASVYGLEYASPKTAESTVLYHLKRNGITRRDSAEHVRKVTEGMVDEWAKRYRAGESLKKIAGTDLSPVTVFYHLTKRGIRLRDKVEAQIKAVTKHAKSSFSADPKEMAYLLGIRRGDFYVVRHGRGIRVRISTTRPAMGDLFLSLFQRYGPVYKYPKQGGVSGVEWSFDADLENSFEFMLSKSISPHMPFQDISTETYYVAGFFDAEGSIYIHMKRGRPAPEISISNSDKQLLESFASKLREFGYHAITRWGAQQLNRAGIKGVSTMGRIHIWRFHDVKRFLANVPFKHADKVAKAMLALQLPYRASDAEIVSFMSKWEALSHRIDKERKQFLDEARADLDRRHTETVSSVVKGLDVNRQENSLVSRY
jgi:intein-encoded DNA endonuclease-like protein